jgi:hypothetical protein
MAQRTKVVVVCDRLRCEVEAVGNVEITINGQRRRLDLCAEHLAELRKDMRPWLRSSAEPGSSTRKPSSRTARRSATTRSGKPRRNTDGPAIRAWAAENGWDLPERGRIPADVREAYTAAH